MKSLAIVFAASIAAVGNCEAQTTPSDSSSGSMPVRSGSEYDILSFVPQGSSNTVYMLRCKNGTTVCNYKWDEICVTGKATNTNPLGTPDTAPGYMRDRENRPMRIFICM